MTVTSNNKIIHDADSHIFEDPGFYLPYADASVRERMAESCLVSVTDQMFEEALAQIDSPDFADHAEEELMQRKLWLAMGSFRREERPRALDLLGFQSQMVFDSFMRFHLVEAERKGDDLDYIYGLARAHNRAIVEFCSSDSRLLPVGYLPFIDIERSIDFAREAIELGCVSLQAPADCPRDHSPSHLGFEPMWALMAEAHVPLIYHLGAGRLINPTFSKNGLTPEPSFLGGDGSIRSIDYVATPNPVMETLSVLIVDGVLHRHPELRIAAMEFGGSWLPGWLKFLDSAMIAYKRNETRLQNLDMNLSDYVHRQVRFTIFAHEDLGWSMSQGGSDLFLFSSDYPHIEGGRNPIGRFSESMDAAGIGDVERDRFFRSNFEDLLGGRVPVA